MASHSFNTSPLVSSVVASTARLKQTMETPDAFRSLHRKQRDLQHQLQFLLDAQSDGLFARLNSDLIDEPSSTGSSTPTMQSVRTARSRPPRKVSLRSARRGIRTAMQQLATVKEEEARLLKEDIRNNQIVLEKIGRWERKRTGLDNKIDAIQKNNDQSRASKLREEAKELESEIHEVELRLSEMKARHFRLVAEADEVENSIQSKLSSYKEALVLLDLDIQKFLSRPPVSPGQRYNGRATFLLVQPKRRNLVMAKDHWQEGQTHLEKEFKNTAMERDALVEGAQVWDEAVKKITAFELYLEEEMHEMGRGRSPAVRDCSEVLSRMDEVIGHIEGKMQYAEDRDWKLLLCAVGAELEAFKQGREILESTLFITAQESSSGRTKELVDLNDSNPHSQFLDPEDPFETHQSSQEKSDTDDDPDPELLVSHQPLEVD